MNPFEQGLLRYLTKEQLAIIQKQHIGIGGAGGLGSNVAMILTRSGFKHFQIIDSDIIDAFQFKSATVFFK
jgi:sulfur carrier protein ThiS adenylyltransferase